MVIDLVGGGGRYLPEYKMIFTVFYFQENTSTEHV